MQPNMISSILYLKIQLEYDQANVEAMQGYIYFYQSVQYYLWTLKLKKKRKLILNEIQLSTIFC